MSKSKIESKKIQQVNINTQVDLRQMYEFDTKEIIAGLSRLKGARRKPTSIALE